MLETEVLSKRLFIGGLSDSVTASELAQRFSHFGKVSNVSLSTRKDNDGAPLKSFAHLDLQGDEASIRKCFSTYQNAKWKGSVMKLQYAKESILERLKKEREGGTSAEAATPQRKAEPSPPAPEVIATAKGVPGTPVPGKKDWVVGKYGRALPVMKLKKSYKIPMVKHDPSKYCHAARVFKEDASGPSGEKSCDSLTWKIDQPDSEITKKRKGEFPETPPSLKKKKLPVNQKINGTSGADIALFQSELKPSFSAVFPKGVIDSPYSDLEIVRIGVNVSNQKGPNGAAAVSNKFDSDIDSDPEPEPSIPMVKKKTSNNQMHLKPNGPSKSGNVGTGPKTVSSPHNNAVNGVSRAGGVLEFRGLSMLSGLGKAVAPLNKRRDSTQSEDSGNSSDADEKPSPKKKLQSPKTMKSAKSKEGDDNSSEKKFRTSQVSESHESSSSLGNLKSGSCDTPKQPVKGVRQTAVSPKKNVDINSGKDKTSPHSTATSNIVGSLSKHADEAQPFRLVPEFKGLGMLAGFNAQQNASATVSRTKDETNNSTPARNSKQNTEHSDSVTPKEVAKSVVEKKKSTHSPADQKSKSNKKPPAAVTPKDDKLTNASTEPPAAQDDDGTGSDCSAGTDEIITRHKAKKTPGLSVISNAQSSVEHTKTQSPLTKIKPTVPAVKVLGPNNSLYMSEFDSGVAEETDNAEGCRRFSPAHNKSDDDSYDSDLDSNDFALVARKLRQMAQGKKTKKDNLGVKKSLPRETPAASEKGSQRESEAGGKQAMTGLQSRLAGIAGLEETKSSPAPSKPMTGEPQQKKSKQTEEEKHKAANEKRLEAVREQARQRQQQQKLMQEALKNVDSVEGNKKRIVFESSSDDESDDEEKSQGKTSPPKKVVVPAGDAEEKPGLKLFDGSSDDESDDEDYDEMFKSKPQFEGKKGEQLLKLEKKFGGDSRFKLDAKFAATDSEDEDEEEESAEKNDKSDKDTGTPDLDKSLKDEKSASLKVLEAIVGKNTLDRFSEKMNRNTKKIIDMNTVRFDPTKILQSSKPAEEETKSAIPALTKKSKKKSDMEETSQPGPEGRKQVKKTGQEEKDVTSREKLSTETEDRGPAEEDVMSEKRETKDSSEKTEESSNSAAKSSRVEVSSSLVDLFKAKSKEDEGMENSKTDGSFSLTQQFGEVDSDDMDEEESGVASKGKTIFSFEKSKTLEAKGKGEDEKMEELTDDSGDEAEVKEKKDEKKTGSSAFFKTDLSSEDEDSYVGEEMETESSTVTSTAKNEEGIDADMINAGKVDVRFTKEKWHEEWDTLRQSIIKIYKKKHKDALKKKRIHGETKRKREFLKNARKTGRKNFGASKKR